MLACIYNYALSLLYKNTLTIAPAMRAIAPCAGEGAEVIDGVFIGSIMTAANRDWLLRNNIAAIVDASGFPYAKSLMTFSVRIEDKPVDLSEIDTYMRVFRQCAHEVARVRACGRRVLVHCAVGINRSATIIGFYLADCGYSYDDIVALLTRANRTRGMDVLTNVTFRYLLRTYCASK